MTWRYHSCWEIPYITQMEIFCRLQKLPKMGKRENDELSALLCSCCPREYRRAVMTACTTRRTNTAIACQYHLSPDTLTARIRDYYTAIYKSLYSGA